MSYHQRIAAVHSRIAPHIRSTPLLTSAYLSQEWQATVLLKCEVLQPTNSFKVRGAMNKLLSLPSSTRVVVTASGGNHGLALAYGAQRTGRQAEVFLPHSTPEYKVNKIKALGGKVTLHGDVWDEANEFAQKYAEEHGGVYVHPFSDKDVIDGQATIAHEILQEHPDTDILISSIGGGGLLSGVSHYAKSLRPEMSVYGVETKGADAMSQSIASGKVITLPAITSIAESLAARRVTQLTFNTVSRYVDHLYTVSDTQTMSALTTLLQEEKLLTEPATACTVGALAKMPNLAGKKVAIILCGGNYPLAALKHYL